MDVIKKIKKVLSTEPNDAQLDKFLSDLRDSLSNSNKQFISTKLLAITALLTYHLVVFEGAKAPSFQGLNVGDSATLQRIFLVIPAALLSATAAIGFLRRWQREVYDYLSISRYRALGESGLHELRVPSDYILGLFYLKVEGGMLGAFVSGVVMLLGFLVFTFCPAAYVVYAAIQNLQKFGTSDLLSVLGSTTSIVLALVSMIIVVMAGRVRA